MSDDWNFYLLQVNDQPASVFLDMGIAEQAPIRSHPVRVGLRVVMLRPRPDGLSSQEEFDDLTALEDGIIPTLTGGGEAIYVGRRTGGGYRDFYFYVSEAAGFEATAQRAMAAFPRYQFELRSKSDPDWTTYFDFLYPSVSCRQQMADRGVQAVLVQHGDDLAQPRMIDHAALFRDPAKAERFRAHVRSSGYELAEPTPPGDDGLLCVEFHRVDSPAAIHEVTSALYAAAADCDGEYDGWGCEVVRSSKARPKRPSWLQRWFKPPTESTGDRLRQHG